MINIEWKSDKGVYKYKGFEIYIRHSDFFESWDDITNGIAYWALSHRKYSLPNTADVPFDELHSWEEVESWILKNYKDIVWIDTVMMYDHSGIAINYGEGFISDPLGWDTSRLGYVFTTKEKIKEWFGAKRFTKKLKEKARKIYESDLRIFKAWAEGDVYDIYDPIDDIWMLAYGNEDIEYIIKHEIEPKINIFLDRMRKRSLQQVAMYIKNRVPEIYRKPFGEIFIRNVRENIRTEVTLNEKEVMYVIEGINREVPHSVQEVK